MSSLTGPPPTPVEAIQPMPELTPEQLDSLRSDIAANGVLVPIVKDQHGRIIDGNNRAAIAAELGIDYPVTVVEVSDDDDAHDRAVSLNCARRHLSREQTRDLLRSEIYRRPDDSDRAIARRVGCSPSTVGSVRAEVRQAAEKLTREARQNLDEAREQVAMMAHLQHRNGNSWQTVGDLLERAIWGQWAGMDEELVEPSVWAVLWGGLFDSIRAYDCPDDCTVCTDFDRQFRDQHPDRVYRWVSKLDSTTAEAVTG